MRNPTIHQIEVPKTFYKKYNILKQKRSVAKKHYIDLKNTLEAEEKICNYESRKIKRLRSELDYARAISGNLSSDLMDLEWRLEWYAKRQKERPIRYNAEMCYGKVNPDGRVCGSGTITIIWGFFGALSVFAAGASVFLGFVSHVGLFLPVLCLVVATYNVWGVIVAISTYRRLNSDIRTEDIHYTKKKMALRERSRGGPNYLPNERTEDINPYTEFSQRFMEIPDARKQLRKRISTDLEEKEVATKPINESDRDTKKRIE